MQLGKTDRSALKEDIKKNWGLHKLSAWRGSALSNHARHRYTLFIHRRSHPASPLHAFILQGLHYVLRFQGKTPYTCP